MATSARSFSDSSDVFWRAAKPLPVNIQELYPAVHRSRLYVAGGIAAKLGTPYFTDVCLSYDPVRDEWLEESTLPENRHHAALCSTANRLFLVGGFNGGYTHVWRMRGEMHELTEGGWEPRSPLPAPQAEGVLSAAPDGQLHLVTGQSPRGTANKARSDHHEVNLHWRYDLSADRWESAAPIPTPRNSATGGWFGNELIVAGGRTASGNLDVTEIYDLKEDKWRTAEPLPLPQAGTAGAIVDDGLIVFGGEIFQPEADVFGNVWRYAVEEGNWQALPALPTPRHGIGAGRIGDEIFVIGGATRPGGRGTTNLNEVLTYR